MEPLNGRGALRFQRLPFVSYRAGLVSTLSRLRARVLNRGLPNQGFAGMAVVSPWDGLFDVDGCALWDGAD